MRTPVQQRYTLAMLASVTRSAMRRSVSQLITTDRPRPRLPALPPARAFAHGPITSKATRHRIAAANARAAEWKNKLAAQPTTAAAHQQRDADAPTLSDAEFHFRASSLLQYLYEGLVEMGEVNPIFDLSLHPSTRLVLKLAPDVGEYDLAVDGASRRVSLLSPMSGVHHYRWNERHQQWASELDGHFLVELLVRELLKVCQGVPKL